MTAKFDGGSPSPIQTVDNGKSLTFNDDGTFADTALEPCAATYTLEGNTITINASCREDIIRYGFDFEDGKLHLMYIPSPCDEGCYGIYTIWDIY